MGLVLGVVVALAAFFGTGVVGGAVVETLPGFSGSLPFELETGYVSVGDLEEVQLFYYFVKSERDSVTDPLLVWLSGGPGCSGLSALLYDIGPLKFNVGAFNGSFASIDLELNPYSWTKQYDKVANLLFIDQPVGAGFSFSSTEAASYTSDTKASKQLYMFLRKWLNVHPVFVNNPLYVGGNSYAGISVPLLLEHILADGEYNFRRLTSWVRLLVLEDPSWLAQLGHIGSRIGLPVPRQGKHRKTESTREALELFSTSHPLILRLFLPKWLLEHPKYLPLEFFISGDSYAGMLIPVVTKKVLESTRMALISNELYERLKVSCNKSYINVEPSNVECTKALQAYNLTSSQPSQWRFLQKISGNSLVVGSPDLNVQLERCRTYNYTLAPIWANDPRVIDELHVRKVNSLEYRFETLPRWIRCNQSLSYTKDVESVTPVHKYLTRHDLNVLVQTWRPWFVGGQVAGYTEQYDSVASGYRLVYATVKGSGHPALESYQKECYQLFDRWVHTNPL
uniref:Uncharacterized protein n=1 Tax=Kalanchoe fedtschenkoi TaxID=63787 RepID=A0A7N0TWD2_KALFE